MKVTKAVRDLMRPEALRDDKMQAAWGMLNLSAVDKVAAMFVLTRDKDEEIKDAARKNFQDFPIKTLMEALKGELDPMILIQLAKMHILNDKVLIRLIDNPGIDPEGLKVIAEGCSKDMGEFIVDNPRQYLIDITIPNALKRNPKIPEAVATKAEKFIRPDKPKAAEPEPPKPEPPKTEEAPKVEPEPEPEPEPELEYDDSDEADDCMDLSAEALIEAVKNAIIPEGLKKDTKEKPKNLMMRVKELNVAGKIKLALEGNKEVRELLIKSTNKLVYTAALKNPRITDDEIIKLTTTKGTSEEILRQISKNREWMQNYQVKLTLITNPKTALGVSIRMLGGLHLKDLEKISKSREVPSGLASNAKKILEVKQKR